MMHRRRIVTKRLLAAIVASSLLLIQDESSTARSEDTSDRSGVILYVDDSGPPQGNGLSWQTAFRYLQDALAIANAPDSGVSEIRIGQGTYKPDQGANQTPGNVMASFRVANFAVRGGYAGFGAPDPDARDFEKFQTILSGDLLGNDGPPGTFRNYQDNTRQIMLVLNMSGTTIVEGLTFRASERQIDIYGGGLRCEGGNARVSHCKFLYNRAYAGAGLQLWHCQGVVEHCIFFNNRALGGIVGVGGGMAMTGASAIVADSRFRDNSSDEFGGAIYAGSGPLHVEHCSFQGNYTGNIGGAVYNIGYEAGRYIDCVFASNTASWSGGAVYLRNSTNASEIFVNCIFRSNYASIWGGALHVNATVLNSQFIDNFSSFQGGAGFYGGGGTLINCEFIRNVCGGDPIGGAGAGVCKPPGQFFDPCGPGTFINCTFRGNDSWGPGGAAWVEAGNSASLINCTLTDNITIGDQGGAVSGPATIHNSISWNNSPAELAGVAEVRYSNIKNGWPGEGNISSSPHFVDLLGPDGIPGTEDDDLRLSAGSPCIDAANNLVLPPDTFDLDNDGDFTEPLPIDLDGFLRRVNDPNTPNNGYPPNVAAIVDMGAYEFRDF